MVNEVGTTLLNSLTNSTFDIGNMSKVLAEAEVAGPRTMLERNQEKSNTELDALKYLQTNLSAFNTYVSDLSSPAIFQQLSASSSNESVISVTAETGAATGSYQVESRQLAQAHTVVFDNSFASTSSAITAGSFNFTVAGQLQEITIDNTNNTLEGLQKYLNNGDFGVSAAVINNGSGYQLMMTSKTSGAAGEIAFSTTPAELSSQTTTAMAQDAQMVLNGLMVTSNTNTFDEVIQGVTFKLNSESVGLINTIDVNQSTETVDEAIRSFVDVYNQLDTILEELGSYDSSKLTQAELESEEFKYFGDLAGSSLLRSVQDQLKASMSGAIEELGGNLNSLAQIGISFDREGKLNIEEQTYTAAIENNLEAVSSLFSKGGTTDDNFINFLDATDRTQTGSYEIFIDQLATRAQWTMVSPDGDASDGVDISGNGAFSISVDGSTEVNLTIADGAYTAEEFASSLASTINNSTEVSSSGSSVSVALEAGNFVIYSNKYGISSNLNLTGFANVGDPALTNGQSVDGIIKTETGDLNLGAYADPDDGRVIKISNYAAINGEPAEVRGLSFEVFGGLDDGSSRGFISYAAGFASRIEEAVKNFFAEDTGLVSSRIDSLDKKLEGYEEKSKDIDLRYERMLMKYQLQFSALQSLLSSSEQTRNMLSATFNRDN